MLEKSTSELCTWESNLHVSHAIVKIGMSPLLCPLSKYNVQCFVAGVKRRSPSHQQQGCFTCPNIPTLLYDIRHYDFCISKPDFFPLPFKITYLLILWQLMTKHCPNCPTGTWARILLEQQALSLPLQSTDSVPYKLAFIYNAYKNAYKYSISYKLDTFSSGKEEFHKAQE